MPTRKPMSGLVLRGGIWHINKRYKFFPGGRLRKSSGFSEQDLDQAEAFLAREMLSARKAVEEGVRPQVLWKNAAAKFLVEYRDKSSVRADASHLKALHPYIGHLPIDQVHDDTLELFKNDKTAAGTKQKSIKNALEVVSRILNLAARRWRHNLSNGRSMTWLETSPLITFPEITDSAESYPLSWEEQRQLISLLPNHLACMALFKVNTGTREQEVCKLRWEWEVKVPELNTSVFLIPDYVWSSNDHSKTQPKGMVKNRQVRVVVLNEVAKSVVEARRGIHPEFVFTYYRVFSEKNKHRRKNKDSCINRPINNMNNSGWQKAWKKAGLPVTEEYVHGVHNLKHTFGRRLRAAGVPKETRKVLLGHTSKDITTHYSAAELKELMDASNSILEAKGNTPTLTLLKLKSKKISMDTNRTQNFEGERKKAT